MSPSAPSPTPSSADLHDPVGRIRINVSMFRPNVEFTLKYNLFLGDLAADRVKPRGTVTVRLRIEWNNTRKALISGILPPQPTYVSVKKPIDFQVALYVTEGKVSHSGPAVPSFVLLTHFIIGCFA